INTSKVKNENLTLDSSSSNSSNFNIENLIFGSDHYYLKNQDEMIDLFKEFPEAINNTTKIAGQCNIELDLKTNHMPNFPIPSTSKANNLTAYMKELVYKGLKDRFNEIPQEYVERAEFEINVIDNMGYPGYFLIVWDFIKAARERGVSVGPGRGSAAGSLVAYALEITNVDPIKYDLLFERFLNPDRVSMPDVDIDFNDEKRDIVIDYVKNKYGEEAVAQIITFGKLTSKAALTDVGRVLGVELSKIKDITKKIPSVFGKVHTIKMSLDLPELKWLKDIIIKGNQKGRSSLINDDERKYFDLIKYSLVVENKVRNTGIHAAGVVIAPGDLRNYVPLHKASKEKETSIEIATQFAMNDLEDGGLLKMDFLGLRTLSIIDKTIEFMKVNHPKSWDGRAWDTFDIDEIPLNDNKTYELFGEGNTLSVFQFESSGMQDYLKKLKPNNLEEITAMNALYRPGPMENIPEFIDRKFGRKEITYEHSSMEDSLKTTYGIIVYQEQVMKLVQDVAGFSLGQADLLRRAMGKKKIKEMEKMMPLFKKGAKELHNINEKLAEEIFDLINKFANYGFNKSHSLAYSYLAYQTAWLKAHYPVEFIAANMTAEMNDQEKIVMLRDEAKRIGIKLLPPDINHSNSYFTVDRNLIYFGLAAIRNVGESAVELIVKARTEKPFTSFYDFVSRVDTRLINKRTIEALICSGALDNICGIENRSRLMASIDLGLDYAKSKEEQAIMNIDSLFGGSGSKESEPKLAKEEPYSENQRLILEKEFLNFYISGHPLFKYEAHINSFPHITTKSNISNNSREENFICGLVNSVRPRLDKKDKPIAFVEMEDLQGKCELIFWSSAYEQYHHLIIKDEIIFASGTVERDDDNANLKMKVNKVYSIDEAIQHFSTGYKIWVDLEDKESEKKLAKLNNLLSLDTENNNYFAYHVFNKTEGYKNVFLSKKKTLSLNNSNVLKLIDIFGYNNVRFLNYVEE
ncbi:DNA polymerase III subunit alpha, partial [Candidatus Kapabacteria bacterium]|nr:DNA polymerase III subunit alpha [Candidatus Kapabacteria bacterium]